MNAPDIIPGIEPAVLGASLGAVLAELTISWMVLLQPLAIVLVLAGQGALIAGISAVVARRVDGFRQALPAVIPGLTVWFLLTGSAWLIWSRS